MAPTTSSPSARLTVPALAAAFRLLCGCGASGTTAGASAPVALRNVSHSPPRELYQDYNAAFAKHWKDLGGGPLTVEMSHRGSGKRARPVIGRVEAGVVKLGLADGIIVGRHPTRRAAEEYLKYLCSPEGPEVAARHFCRPRLVDQVFGVWRNTRERHPADAGVSAPNRHRPGLTEHWRGRTWNCRRQSNGGSSHA
jgi:ABC-type sulfate transport system substrate-binding protein